MNISGNQPMQQRSGTRRYAVPGLHIEESSIQVPLDWTGNEPGHTVSAETIDVFYRVVDAPEHVHADLPFLMFLQGGPGGAAPRPMNPESDGWIAQAIQHFHVILPDQRGTGRSSHVDARTIAGMSGTQAADYLKHFLADSIIRDFEHLRLTRFEGRQLVTLGQSYGGFLTLTYLSLFPQALAACFTTGGIPHVPASATEVYEHTVPRMQRKTEQYYARYKHDKQRVAAVADFLTAAQRNDTPVLLPNGDVLSVPRLQTVGQCLGMKPSFETLHWLFDTAFRTGSGDAPSLQMDPRDALTDAFVHEVGEHTYSRALYWPLQEFIYANGELEEPINWAAAHVVASQPQFSPEARPLLFFGEAIFPWMFEQERELRPFRPAMDVLMQDTHFGRIYDADQLARNEVPLQAAVYFDDMYVDATLSLDTLSRLGNAHAWVTNEFEHDGVHGPVVFKHLYELALDRGDLEPLY
ncbi:alpha/beta fold hydrolase [Bifidobacterium gallicum]|uniref:Hydrolase, alpha/beta domain protein n=1 Tax=Bifidobacterium gallicum DSM 20093 = LMG 11596 TaxID=561180 RepID=D1NS08_9BIFI|nr:alpha/beta fold hydrolase [Bifidobacterium gallicum]EFA23460.1 hydrolase, alpha/beta domain protein [Bifidobacterium gallicum DSM 20093 = LMG 11596]KFI57252.1 proline iminopeptidase [Bifidobacterium gallicum DSM 20093 = LMG 11596]